MKFRFSKKVTLICGILIIAMLKLSHWQWQRHLEKIEYINTLQARLEIPPVHINEILEKNIDFGQLPYRRLLIAGEYDFPNEIILRNRRLEEQPGVHVLTPLKLKGREERLLVSRGFIPLSYSAPEKRRTFQRSPQASFVGLIKESQPKKFLAPADPEVPPRLDAWLRPDLEKIQKQLPYKILPFYAELIGQEDADETKTKILTVKSDREEMFFMAKGSGLVGSKPLLPLESYPVPSYDTVVPPGRHLGYVFEWLIMAVITFFIGLVLQLRRPAIAQAAAK